ncbi:uncharacterized protein LOC135127881 [Zophobas morio]|uniref:uncharacterized protein LOC135127881 n=1 Tax=Zophobas morio TaxID=2755281 RepID=UPI0030833432
MDRIFSRTLVFVLLSTLHTATSTPLPDRVFVRNETSVTHNQTIADLVQRQTDTIKKIISNHHIDYPVITKYPPDDKQKKSDPIPFDELKIKCQHLARLISTTTPTPRNISGFYITSEEPPPTTPKPSPAPVKYIKLEPVILQKTIMSDGRTIYYWHKSIPSQFAPATPTTPPPTTTTPAPGYNFRNFFPSFYSIGGSEPVGATTTEKAPTSEEMHLYQQQLKFVVPVPFVPAEDPGVKKPWEIDQYAYYPKPLQPENVNMQVPYVPTFHVIKAVAVPNQYEGGSVDGM